MMLTRYELRKASLALVFLDLDEEPELKTRNELHLKTSKAIKRLNIYLGKVKGLAGINKPLTMHFARHTFGNVSGERIPV